MVMDPIARFLEDVHDILVVSYRWPRFTRAFVDAPSTVVGGRVLGVFEADEPVGREFFTLPGVSMTGSPRAR